MTTHHRIIKGDVLQGITLIPEQSVQVCISSPPYLWARDYGVVGQIGLEDTPENYIRRMVEVGREVRRVLRDDGTFFVNIGDSYAGSGKGPSGENGCVKNQEERQGFDRGAQKNVEGMKPKDLIGVPWMLAQALRADGWYWRKWFPWIKKNCLPESVDDRPGSSLEIIHMFAKSGSPQYWTHPKHNATRIRPDPDYIYKNMESGEITASEPENWRALRCSSDKKRHLWVRRNLWEGHDYFWDPDAIRVRQSLNTHSRENNTRKKEGGEDSNIRSKPSWNDSMMDIVVPGGRNRRDSDWFFESWQDLLLDNIAPGWQGLLLDGEGLPAALVVNPEPFGGEHFAVFPQNLALPLILGGSSEHGCCPACGAPYIRMIDKGDPLTEWKKNCGADADGGYNGTSWKYEKLIHGKTGHFHEKEKKQDMVGKATYTGFNERWQQNASDVKRRILAGMRERITRWVPSCDCNAGDPVPCIVFDPFLGRGTITKVSRDTGRSSVGCELSAKYIKIMKKWLAVHQSELDTGAPVATYSFEEAGA